MQLLGTNSEKHKHFYCNTLFHFEFRVGYIISPAMNLSWFDISYAFTLDIIFSNTLSRFIEQCEGSVYPQAKSDEACDCVNGYDG